MADAHAKEHDYHLVDPSPWPFVGSIGAFVMMLGGVVAMKPDPVLGMSGPWVFYIGLAMVLYTFVGWWRDVTKEAEHQGHHTPVVQLHHRYGMVLFIASEVMFFVAWFWAYFDVAFFAGEVAQYARVEATGGVWPPVGIETFDPFHLPLMNTLVLLTSGTTVTWAHHALQQGDREGLKWGLICTVLLGILFSALQAYEYSHAAFGF
ncbi:MAG: cytochrome c oxidase subunit 3, partial [Pseudomonadota bacterium]